MRKIAYLLVLLFVSCFSVFASDMCISSLEDISAGTEISFPLYLDVQELENEYVNIGFSGERITEAHWNSEINSKDSVSIAVSEESGFAYNEEEFYAYWQIKHGGKLHIRIYSESPYSKVGDEGDIHYHILNADNDNDVLFSGFEDSSSGYLEGSILYSHDGREQFGSVGSVKLLVETEIIGGMPSGSYNTQLVLQVLSD